MTPTGLGRIGAALIVTLAIAAIGAPWLAPYDPTRAIADSFGEPWPPQAGFWLGTDELGRDVLSRLLYGARVSGIVAVAATAISLGIGVSIGLASGYLGGWVDTLLMRLTDVFVAFPALLLAIAMAAVLEPGLTTVLVVIGLVAWTAVARVVRSEVLSLREREFVLAAEALGAPPRRIMRRHVLPNVLPTLITMAALNTSSAILLDAGLSYLGLGVPVPTPSWGRMISDSQSYYRVAPWLIVCPGAAIGVAVLGFNLMGYGLLAGNARRREAS